MANLTAKTNTTHNPDAAAKHPLSGLLSKHGFGYDGTTAVPDSGGDIAAHHAFTRGQHTVAVAAHNHDWASTPPNGKLQQGVGVDALDKHLQKLKPKNEAADDLEAKVGQMLTFETGDTMSQDAKRRMTALFIEAASKYAGEGILDLCQMTEEAVERMENVVTWMEGQMQAQEQRQDFLSTALNEMIDDVYSDDGTSTEFLERVRQRIQAQGSNNFKDGAGVSDDAHGRNLASVKGKSIAHTNSTGDHGGVVKESLSAQTRNLLDMGKEALTESASHQNYSHTPQRKTLGLLLGSTNLKGRTKSDGSQQRSQTLMEMKPGMTSVDVYCALEDAKKSSWASGR